MAKRLQRGAGTHPYTMWTRLLAFACVLLIGLASSAQAVHVHGQFLPGRGAQAGAQADASRAPGEASCPLCVAMHSALPATMQTQLASTLLVECPTATAVDRIADETWNFAMFSRPPPAVGSL